MAGASAGHLPSGLPLLQLAHRGEVTSSGRFRTTRYTLHKIDVPRPPAGVAAAAITCGTCGNPVRCVLYSAVAARRRQRRHAAVGCSLLGGLAVVWSGVIFTAGHHGISLAVGWIVLLWGVLILGSIVILSFAVGHAWLPGGQAAIRLCRAGVHSLRLPGDTTEVSDTFHEPGF